jgi:hypothetical protein
MVIEADFRLVLDDHEILLLGHFNEHIAAAE